MKPSKTPQEAIEAAVAMLQAGPNASPEYEIRAWIRRALESAAYRQRQDRLDADHEAAQKKVREAAEAMMNALMAVHALEPWIETEEGRVCLSSSLPLEDPERFERDVHTLTRYGVQETSWVIQEGRWAGQTVTCANPPRKKTRPKIPPVVVMLHCAAQEMLKQCGINPTKGSSQTAKRDSSASVTHLGGLLCSAAGVFLTGGESTKAARLACSPRELFAAAGITWKEIKPLPNQETTLNNPESTT